MHIKGGERSAASRAPGRWGCGHLSGETLEGNPSAGEQNLTKPERSSGPRCGSTVLRAARQPRMGGAAQARHVGT